MTKLPIEPRLGDVVKVPFDIATQASRVIDMETRSQSIVNFLVKVGFIGTIEASEKMVIEGEASCSTRPYSLAPPKQSF